jgi:hypothetical protein
MTESMHETASSSRSGLRPAIASAAFAGLAACLGPSAGTVVGSPYFSSYSPSMVRDGMHVAIVGNPFQAPDEKVADTVAEHMRGANGGSRETIFYSRDTDGLSLTHKMRVALNSAVNAEGICRDNAIQAAGQSTKATGPQRIDAVMAFCLGQKRISSVRGHATNVTDVDDPTFRALLRIMTREVLPPVDPNRIGDGRDGGDFE